MGCTLAREVPYTSRALCCRDKPPPLVSTTNKSSSAVSMRPSCCLLVAYTLIFAVYGDTVDQGKLEKRSVPTRDLLRYFLLAFHKQGSSGSGDWHGIPYRPVRRLGSEFLGKRDGKKTSIHAKRSVDFDLIDKRRVGSEFLGKRRMGSEFLGKRRMGSEFLGKRGMGSEFLGKRAMGSEFLGKRAMGSEFLGKRRMGSEFLGKRSMGSEFLGKRAMGSEFLGKRGMGSEFLGKRAMGSEFLGKRGMGSEFLGKRGMGSEFLGKRGMGSEFLGKRGMGSEFLGKRAIDSNILDKLLEGQGTDLSQENIDSDFLGDTDFRRDFLNKCKFEFENTEDGTQNNFYENQLDSFGSDNELEKYKKYCAEIKFKRSASQYDDANLEMIKQRLVDLSTLRSVLQDSNSTSISDLRSRNM